MILAGDDAVLRHAALLERLSARHGQPGAFGWLPYFLSGKGSRWKKPVLVAFVQDDGRGELCDDTLVAAAFFFELTVKGVGTGAFATDDWQGFRTVVAPPGSHEEFAQRAMSAVIEDGAQVVLASVPETGAEAARQHNLGLTGCLWARGGRSVCARLLLEPTYEAMLARFGKKTRIGLRSNRRKLSARMELKFLPDAHESISRQDAMVFGESARNPIERTECERRFEASTAKGGFMMALRGGSELLSLLTGWRQGGTTVIHSQMNASGHEKESIGTVMRSFLIEHEIARGTRELVFYHGTDHPISHVFSPERVVDLVVRRKSLRADVIRMLARRVATPDHYREAHFLGGSSTFFAAVLASADLLWQETPAALPGSRQSPAPTPLRRLPER